MSASCQLIFRVVFEHAFFADGRLRGVRIVPVPACYDMLRRAGILLRDQGDGVAAFGDDKAIERLRLHIAEAGGSLAMAFQVFFTDPHFFEYTVPAWPRRHVLFLGTAWAGEDAGDAAGRRMLHAGPHVSAAAFKTRDDADVEAILGPRVLPPTPAAVLQLGVSASLLDETDAQRRCFHVRFDAAASRWKYCVFGAGESQLGIVDLAGDIEFDRYAGVDIADGRRADVFLSRREIPMREVSEARFQLRAAQAGGDKVLIKRMPNASVGTRCSDSRDGNEILVSEVFINM